MGAGGQGTVHQGAYAGTDQASHRVPDRLAHAPNLSVSALVDGDPQHRGLDQHRPGRSGTTILEHHPLPEPPHRRRGGTTLHLGQVLLVHPERGMGEPVGQVAVVGK